MDVFYKDTVTVYNRHEENYAEKWYPSVLKGVRLIVGQGANIGKNGMDNADNARLHISFKGLEKPYVQPKAWGALEEKEKAFTLQQGDFFVKGDTTGEDAGQADFAEYMKRNHDDVYTVTTVNTYSLIPHLEAGGK